MITTNQAGLLLPSHLAHVNQSKGSMSDYYFLDITISQQPREFSCTKMVKVYFTVTPARAALLHFSVSPALACTSSGHQ